MNDFPTGNILSATAMYFRLFHVSAWLISMDICDDSTKDSIYQTFYSDKRMLGEMFVWNILLICN